MNDDVSVQFGGSTSGLDDASRRAANDVKSVGTAADGLRSTFGRLASDSRVAVSSFEAVGAGAHVSATAMRESLVLAREAARGNYSRMAGSLTILMQATQAGSGGLRGFAKELLNLTGVLKTTRDAELAEEAAAAMASANAVRAAAQKAEANIVAADTEMMLAEAQLRNATTATEEAAAQARLAVAMEAVSAASAEAAVAQDALAIAEERAATAGEAAAAAEAVGIGATGVAFLALAPIAAVAYGSIRQFQGEVQDSGALTKFRDSLGLTHAEMLKLGEGVDKTSSGIKELGPVTVTVGDTMRGLWDAIVETATAGANASMWNKIKQVASSAFNGILDAWNVTSAGITAGIDGTFTMFKVLWSKLPAVMGDLFVQGVNAAIGAINSLLTSATNGVNWFIDKVNSVAGKNIIDRLAPPGGIAEVANRWQGAAAASGKAISDGYSQAYKKALADNAAFWAKVKANAIKHREDIMTQEADAIKSDRTPKHTRQHKPKDDHTAEKQLAAFLEEKRAEQDAAQDDYQKKLAIEEMMLTAIAAVYGKDSKQYQTELRRKEQMERDWAKQKDAITRETIDHEAKMAEEQVNTAQQIANAKLSAERDRLDADANLGRISDAQKERALIDLFAREIDLERQHEDAMYQIKLKALQDELKLGTLSTDERRRINNDIEALEQEHTDRMAVIDAQGAAKMSKAQQDAFASVASNIRDKLSPVVDGFNSMLQGMEQGTMSWKRGMLGIADNVINYWIQKGVQWAANWAVMELAKTSATTAGVATRTSVEAAGATTSNAISAASAVKQIIHKAAVAAAGAYAAIASIPVVGPFLAPAAAAAALYGVYRLASTVFSAAGGAGEVANDGDMYQLHKKEMVLPAKFANPLRNMLAGPRPSTLALGAATAGETVRSSVTNQTGGDTFNYSPTHNRQDVDLDTLLRREGATMRKWFVNQARDRRFGSMFTKGK